MRQVVTFLLDETRFGLPLPAVERVVPAPWITPLPKAPAVVLGIFDLQGKAIPAVSLRRRFGLPERPIELTDRFIVAHTGRRPVALHVDAVAGVVECSDEEIVVPDSIAPGIGHVSGVALLDDGLLLIQDLGAVLSLEEDQVLARALEDGA
ncbi:MAG TPA: chemotaxis protein CheW [Burkholderiales bacterium]|nr:chemotaxis protein CheW [Burkholderiales bacterium]